MRGLLSFTFGEAVLSLFQVHISPVEHNTDFIEATERRPSPARQRESIKLQSGEYSGQGEDLSPEEKRNTDLRKQQCTNQMQ
jgi:hypothetical protein